jgi:hypothetical protein
VDCVTPTIAGIVFYTKDTAAIFTQCKKGTDYSVVTNTATVQVDTLHTHTHDDFFSFPVSSTSPLGLPYEYDYIITLLPSGAVHHLNNVVSHHSSMKHQLGPLKDNCYNQVTYSLDGSSNTRDMMPDETSNPQMLLY